MKVVRDGGLKFCGGVYQQVIKWKNVPVNDCSWPETVL